MNTNKVQIVLATVDETSEAIPGQWTTSRGDGLNAVAKLRTVKYAKAMMWLRAGNESDVAKARAYGLESGYSVHVFPTEEKDPLGKAKIAALKH
jgi:hypothetical protein